MPKIDVYGWAGVNTTKSPIQLEHGELIKAQNAFRDTSGEHGSLHKRPGLVKVNANALSGSVFGFVDVPLNLITTRRFLIGIDQGVTTTYQWITSTDAFATTATATSPGACARPNGAGSNVFRTVIADRGTQLNDLFLYPGDYTRGDPVPIRIYDGTVDQELLQIPISTIALANEGATNYAISNGAILQLLIEGSKLYIVSHDFSLGAAPHYSRLLEYDFETGTLQQIGEGCSIAAGEIGTAVGGPHTFTCCAFHQGYLYAGVGPVLTGEGSTAAGVYRIRPGVDTSWVYDFDNSAQGEEVPTCMASYKGKLYVGMTDFNSTTCRVMVRDYAGAYTSSTTQGTTDNSAWTDMKVFGDNLYACSYDDNGASSQTRIHKFDGTTWSVVKTIDSGTNNPRMGVAMAVHNSRLYVLAVSPTQNGLVTHTADGTTWTDQATNMSGTNLTSIFGVLTT